MIASSLATHGQFRPLTVNARDNRILKGNNTYKAALKLGWKKIAVVMVDVDDQQARRILLADNRAADLATYDVAMLLETLGALPSLDGTGFSNEDLQALVDMPIADPDPEPAPKENGMGEKGCERLRDGESRPIQVGRRRGRSRFVGISDLG